jgi:hypothetical protein
MKMPIYVIDLFSVYIDPERKDWNELFNKFKIFAYDYKLVIDDPEQIEECIKEFMSVENIEPREYKSVSNFKMVRAESINNKAALNMLKY